MFGRRANAPAEPATPLPLVLTSADLATATQMMDLWDRSLGNSDAVWDCLECVARAGGFQGQLAAIQAITVGEDTGEVIDRPWRWWAQAAELALTEQDPALAARIFLFAQLFVMTTLGDMRAVDQAEVGLGRPQPQTLRRIISAGTAGLEQLPAELLIHDTATGRVDVTSALQMARTALAEA